MGYHGIEVIIATSEKVYSAKINGRPNHPLHAVRYVEIDLLPFGPRCEKVGTTELAAAAWERLGAGIDASFPRFVGSLRSQSYVFDGFEDGPPRFAERHAYLRHDVHGRGLLAAYVRTDWHDRLRIVGSFQINWRHTKAEELPASYFVKLLEFDRRYVQFGLHAAPTAAWYVREKPGGDGRRQSEAVSDDDFIDWLRALKAAYDTDGDDASPLPEIKKGSDAALSEIAASFREIFSYGKSIPGHSNLLANGFSLAAARDRKLRPLAAYFLPVEYMCKIGVGRFGLDYELTALGSDHLPFPSVLTAGAPGEVHPRWYRGRVEHGAGFVALLYPATWTCQCNSSFFLPEAAPDGHA